MKTTLENKLKSTELDDFNLDIQVSLNFDVDPSGMDVRGYSMQREPTCDECSSSGGGSGSRVSSCVE